MYLYIYVFTPLNDINSTPMLRSDVLFISFKGNVADK